MESKRYVPALRWIASFTALAAIVACYRAWAHVNPTTVALTLLLYILILAARLGLQYAVAVSVAATACYNFYFLPPVGAFTIADPQNWLALFAFLATSLIGSRLSEQARDEAAQARKRRSEVELLFRLSRELLQTDKVADLFSILPELILSVSGSSRVVIYLIEGDRLYQSGVRRLSGNELPHLRQLALGASDVQAQDDITHIPLRAGARPRGILTLADLHLSQESYEAIGGLVSIAIDRAQALENVARNEASKESERLRNLILDSITHELRTPLTSIKGAASALLSNAEVNPEDRTELLTIVDEEADRLNRLVGQAVEMAQLEAREIRMNFATTSIAAIVERASSACAWTSSGHPVTIQVPPTLSVYADEEMIEKVLCNLLDNAAKYSAPGSPIYISAEQSGDLVVTSVADRGIGIDLAEQGLIFDRLYRSRTQSSTVSGTGMGLAISRAIVESHTGIFTLVSQVGQGSVFSFTLPTGPPA